MAVGNLADSHTVGSAVWKQKFCAADSVICISETLRHEAISRGVNENKISVVPNAVDAEVVRNESDLLHEMKNKLDEKLVVGYIGSLRELEGVDLTAEAVSILNKRESMSTSLYYLHNLGKTSYEHTAMISELPKIPTLWGQFPTIMLPHFTI